MEYHQMPSFPIDTSAQTRPIPVTDFNIGIAETWLEAARDGGVVNRDVQRHIRAALANCEIARRLLRELHEGVQELHS